MKKILDINQRILYIIDNHYNGSQKKFAERIGFAAQVVFNIVSGRKSKPSYDVLYAIISTNDYINSEWLLMGYGETLKSEVKGLDQPDTSHYKELAAARLEIIEGLKFKVTTLEKELATIKQAPKDPILYKNVAEPAPELIAEKHK